MSERLSELEFERLLDEAAQRVSVGGRYRHYKGGLYTVTGLAILEATEEVCVIYRAEYGEHLSFVRALSVWLEMVDVDGTMAPRFAHDPI